MFILDFIKKTLSSTYRFINTKEEPIVEEVESVNLRKRVEKFGIGDRVIVIDNEPTPYHIGTVVDYTEIGINKSPIPIVRFGLKDIDHMCFSHLEPFDLELCGELDKLHPIEQWNYVVHDHAQLKTHKGIKYRTWECQCDSCKRIREEKNAEDSTNESTQDSRRVESTSN